MNDQLPVGARLVSLAPHNDARGVFTETFRQEWLPDAESFLQWNIVCSQTNVLRGVHVHIRHADYLTVLIGKATFMLRDLRRGSPTCGTVARVDLSAPTTRALYIPPGVAHGFYFHCDTIHVYGVTHYWDMADELGCRFDDPDLEMAWPNKKPLLSERDEQLPSLKAILPKLPTYDHYQSLR